MSAPQYPPTCRSCGGELERADMVAVAYDPCPRHPRAGATYRLQAPKAGYPAGWPTCACGEPALDGKETCGAAPCAARAARERGLSAAEAATLSEPPAAAPAPGLARLRQVDLDYLRGRGMATEEPGIKVLWAGEVRRAVYLPPGTCDRLRALDSDDVDRAVELLRKEASS